MSFEDDISGLNQAYFFREFTYSSTKFRASGGSSAGELELADSLLWVGTDLVVYQLKERERQPNTTPEQERSWFERKVLRKGTKQVRDTLRYLRSEPTIQVENHRGHRFELPGASIENIHTLIVFNPVPELPLELATQKFHLSRTAGPIHLNA